MATKQTKTFKIGDIVGETKKAIETGKLLTQIERKRIGNLIVKQIRERTMDGVGVDETGREYKLANRPYSQSYSEYKGVSRTDVDLTLTGDMLENIFVKNVDDKKIEISVKSRDYGKLRGAEEGVKQKVGGRVKLVKRPFFNVSKNDLEEIKQSSSFKRIFENAGRRLAREKSKELRGK